MSLVIKVRNPAKQRTLFVLGLWGVFGALDWIDNGAIQHLFAWIGIAGFIATLWLIARRSGPAEITIDPEQSCLRFRFHPWSGKNERTQPLARWRIVHSYITNLKYPINVVELRDPGTELEVLSLSAFEPTSHSSGHLSIPVPGEAPDAAALRASLVASGLFTDGGFTPMGIRSSARDLAQLT